MSKLLLLLIPLLIFALIGVLLIYVTDPTGVTAPGQDYDPNKDFKMPEKVDFMQQFTGESIEYTFEGRKGPRKAKTVYDPSNWLLTLYPQSKDRSTFKVTEGSVTAIEGYMLTDGIFRLNSYRGVAGEPREFWQTLFNIAFFLPRNQGEAKAPIMREFTFPSVKEHYIGGMVLFREEGLRPLGDGEYPTFHVEVHVEVLTRSRRDLLTLFFAEGLIYYDPVNKRTLAGEFEWAAGRMDQIYNLGGLWNYMQYFVEGFRPKDSFRDYLSMSANLAWVLRRKTGNEAYARMAFENGARNVLYNIAEAQERFRRHALVDQDGDGKGEYGLLSEVSGASGKLRTADGAREWPVPKPDLRLRSSYGQVDARGVSREVDQYRYMLFLKSHDGFLYGKEELRGRPEDADVQEESGSWCAWAWPDKPGLTGNKVFFTNGDKVWVTLHPPFEVGKDLPKPKDTRLPDGVEWTFEQKGAVTRSDYELVTLAGKEIKGRSLELLTEILALNNELDIFKQDKVLGQNHFLMGIFLIRDLLKSRIDGRLSDTEARDLHDRFNALVAHIILGLAHDLLGLAEADAVDRDMPADFTSAVTRLRSEYRALKEGKADAKKARQLLNRIRVIFSQGNFDEGEGGK
jgi:hypothetical protein